MYATIADFAGVSPGTQGNPFGDGSSCCRCSKRYFQSGTTAFPGGTRQAFSRGRPQLNRLGFSDFDNVRRISALVLLVWCPAATRFAGLSSAHCVSQNVASR